MKELKLAIVAVGLSVSTWCLAQELKPIVIEDKRQYVQITSETYVYDSPEKGAAILQDEFGNKEMLHEGSRVLVHPFNDEVYCFEFDIYNPDAKRLTAYFPKSASTPVLTQGIPETKTIYVVPVGEEPEDDIGCWTPSQEAYFVYPNHFYVMLAQGFEDYMEMGILQGGALKPVWMVPVRYEIDDQNPDSFKFHIPAPGDEDQTVSIITGSNCLLKNKGIKEDQLGIPDIFIWPANDIINTFVPNQKPTKCLISRGLQPDLITKERLDDMQAKPYVVKQ